MILVGFNSFAVKILTQNLRPALLLVTKFGIGGLGLMIYLGYSKVPLVWNKYSFYGCLIGAWWAGIMVLYYTAIARAGARSPWSSLFSA